VIISWGSNIQRGIVPGNLSLFCHTQRFDNYPPETDDYPPSNREDSQHIAMLANLIQDK